MKRYKSLIYSSALMLTINIGIAGYLGQDNKSEEKQIEQWKKNIKKYPPSKYSKEIELLFSFPEADLQEKNIYLWGAKNIGIDHAGNVYVIDSRWKSIFKFDSKGAFIKRQGRNGQGPGEFMNPYCMYVADKYVLVSDTSKYEILIFDLELNYKKSFKVFKSYMEIAASNDGLIYGAPMRMKSDMPLVDVLNDEGQILFSFGKPMFGNAQKWSIPNFIKIDVNENKEVYVAFQHFSTVCKYDKKGQLTAVYKINNAAMKEREKSNVNSIQNNERVYWPVIYRIRAGKQGFYIMHNAPFTQILEINEKGEIKNDYWFVRSYDYIADDFLVKENGEFKFIVLQRSPQNQIEVFRPKNDKF